MGEYKLFNNVLVPKTMYRLLKILNSKFSILYSVRGFTISEMIVVIGVSVVLTSIVFVFGNPARQQVALSVEQARLSQIILRAKSLAVATFNQPPVPCGYGVAVDYTNNKYSIFSYEKYNGRKRDCTAIGDTLVTMNAKACGPTAYNEADPPYGPDSSTYPPTCYTELETYTLPRGITFESGGTDVMEYVLFRPPDPTTVLFPMPLENPLFKTVTIKTSTGSRLVKVNSAGQLSFK